jgi:formylglycine-generating enzyme required for sulfatase activity
MSQLNLENLIINDQYKVLSRLAQGSYAEIYEAWDSQQNRAVIVKALNTHLRGTPDIVLEQKLIENFKLELALIESLRHPNIVRMIAHGVAQNGDGRVFRYLVLEHVDGGNLYDHCRENPLSLSEAIHYFRPVCDALSFLHSRGVIHRDVKPGNLLFDAASDSFKLIDFGVAKLLSSGNNREVTRVGTDLYSPPEHHPHLAESHEPLTPSADVYSLAKTMYMALTGRVPNEFRRRQIDSLPPELSGEHWGGRLLATLRRATSHGVSQRYASVEDFWREILALAFEQAQLSSPDTDDTTHPSGSDPKFAPAEPPHPRPRPRNRIELDLAPSHDNIAAMTPPVPQPMELVPEKDPGIKISLVVATLLVTIALVLALQSLLKEYLSGILAGLTAALISVAFTTSIALIVSRRKSRKNSTAIPDQRRELALSGFAFDVVTVDAQGRVAESRKGQAQVFAERLDGNAILEMVAIPAGKFVMGSPETEAGRTEHEAPRHQVKISSFFIGKFPVTQMQWRVVAQWPKVSRDLNPGPSVFTGDDLPVENVSWNDAEEFCERLSKKTGRNYRLPSEAEWEYACRAGTETPFHFGGTLAPGLANYDYSIPYGSGPRGPARESTSRVGAFGVANGFGLFDMHGNVWEWCADLWHDNYAGAPADGRVRREGGDDSLRVVRGGAWFNAARLCRSAYRYWGAPDSRGHNCGFRIAMTFSQR